jgi:hypothetical protein
MNGVGMEAAESCLRSGRALKRGIVCRFCDHRDDRNLRHPDEQGFLSGYALHWGYRGAGTFEITTDLVFRSKEPRSLMLCGPQNRYGIDPGSPASRKVSGQDGNQGEQDHHGCEGERIRWADPIQQ